MNIFFVALLLAATLESASAQVALDTDVGVTLVAEPTNGMVSGQYIHFTLSATNYGPHPATVLIIESSEFTNQIAGLISDPNECYLVATIVDGTVSSAYVSWYVAGLSGSPNLQVGETRICHFQIALSAFAPPIWSFSFGVSTYDPDLNAANDVGTVTLRQAMRPVPTLSKALHAILALLLVVLTGLRGIRARWLSAV